MADFVTRVEALVTKEAGAAGLSCEDMFHQCGNLDVGTTALERAVDEDSASHDKGEGVRPMEGSEAALRPGATNWGEGRKLPVGPHKAQREPARGTRQCRHLRKGWSLVF